jgi:hypothetical protein
LRRDVTQFLRVLLLMHGVKDVSGAHENKEMGERRRTGGGEKKTYKVISERFLLTPRPHPTHVSPISSYPSSPLVPLSVQLVPAGNLAHNHGLEPLVCPGGMCPLGVSTPAFPPGTKMWST